MKIAVASTEKKEEAEISPQAGRSTYFLIFNEKGEILEELSNPFAIGGGGAGIAIAKMMADKNVDVLVAGRVGYNMKDALDEKGIKSFERKGIVKEVLKEFLK